VQPTGVPIALRVWYWQRLINRDCQGYALIEYPTLDEARAAIDGAHNTKLLDQTIEVDFAFVRPPPKGKGRPPAKGRARSRSRSPVAREEGGD